jgi:hypothetical protein
MTLFRQFTVKQDSQHVDGYSRLKVASMNQIFEARFNYGENLALFESYTATGGTVTYSSDYAGFTLATTTSSGSKAFRISARYISQPIGRSMLINMSGKFATAKTNLTSRIGWFDDEDGVFFEMASDGLYAVKRSKISGSVVDTRVHQADWNIDKLNGTGQSGLTLDLTKIQTIQIHANQAGTGDISLGFMLGTSIIAHTFYGANTQALPIMRQVSLPLQFELLNTGSTASSSEMLAFSVSAFIDGPSPTHSLDSKSYYVDSGTTGLSISTSQWTPMISVKLNATKNSIKYRGNIVVDEFKMVVNSVDPIMYQLMLNVTLSGTTNWITPTTAPGSALLIDRGATGYSGGFPLKFGYFAGGVSNQARTNASVVQADDVPLVSGKPYGTGHVITFGARAMSGSTSVFFAAQYFETEE